MPYSSKIIAVLLLLPLPFVSAYSCTFNSPSPCAVEAASQPVVLVIGTGSFALVIVVGIIVFRLRDKAKGRTPSLLPSNTQQVTPEMSDARTPRPVTHRNQPSSHPQPAINPPRPGPSSSNNPRVPQRPNAGVREAPAPVNTQDPADPRSNGHYYPPISRRPSDAGPSSAPGPSTVHDSNPTPPNARNPGQRDPPPTPALVIPQDFAPSFTRHSAQRDPLVPQRPPWNESAGVRPTPGPVNAPASTPWNPRQTVNRNQPIPPRPPANRNVTPATAQMSTAASPPPPSYHS